MARLGPVRQPIEHLTVSTDGRYLAGTLHNGHGLQVWERTGADLATWLLVAEDRDYGGEPSYGAAFDRAGVLYTVAYDGKLRRYTPDYKAKPTWVATRGGKQPFSVAVHPSGDRVAVGYVDTTAVDVYDAATLAWRFAADTKSVINGNLASVTWSADGDAALCRREVRQGRAEPNSRLGPGRSRARPRTRRSAKYKYRHASAPLRRRHCHGRSGTRPLAFLPPTALAGYGRKAFRPTRAGVERRFRCGRRPPRASFRAWSGEEPGRFST